MQRTRLFFMAVLATSVTGCATMNPYVQHSRNVAPKNIKACRGDIVENDKALNYACAMAIRMEKARAEIVTSRSTLTAAVFPLVGIVGYNSARGINGATNAALAAGGFAGYSAITTLAQPDRIRVYDNGIRSTYCAIGIYQVGIASGVRESAGRVGARRAADELLGLIHDALGKSKSSALYSKLYAVEGIRTWLDTSGPNRSYEAQLMKFTRETVADVNAQLTLTVPDNKQLIGDAFSTLQSGIGAKAGRANEFDDAARSGFIPEGGVTATEADEITERFEALNELYKRIANEEASLNATPLDFNSCAYTDITDIGVKDAISRFMLGPGDQWSGRTMKLARGTTRNVNISGGVLPYTAAVALESGTGKVKAEVAGGLMTISVPADDPGGTYRVDVNDATNRYSKSLWVEVPPP